jgi:hypothetical protein
LPRRQYQSKQAAARAQLVTKPQLLQPKKEKKQEKRECDEERRRDQHGARKKKKEEADCKEGGKEIERERKEAD